jgi:outer membrane biosynthesis protein TonB
MRNSAKRLIGLIVSMIVYLIVTAQTNSDIENRLNQSGKVTVTAPQGLAKRNNSSLDKPVETKKTVKKTDDETFAELDDEHERLKDKDKDKEKEKVETHKQPKRERTAQQTIQGRGVGYRIQAYSDNNYRTAKASAQARARAIAMKFPQYRSYISYNAPTWRLRLGDFKSHSEAQAALSRIRSVFPNYAREMTIVRDHINVWQ